MTSLIVALSTADVTVRAVTVCVLAVIAMVMASSRFERGFGRWSGWRQTARRPMPIYLRVDQRPSPEHRQPDLRRRATAMGGLAAVAVVGGVLIAISVSLVLATAVASITNLLR